MVRPIGFFKNDLDLVLAWVYDGMGKTKGVHIYYPVSL